MLSYTPMKQSKDKKKNRSPLKSAPLRNPGQSLDEGIIRLLDDEVIPYLIVAMGFIGITLYEWFRWYTDSPPQPFLFTFVALIITPYLVWKLANTRKKLHALKLGRDGEKAVGQYLELLRESGYRVLNDIVSESFNVDHVLIGPAGVFTIETKTISKPAVGEAVIHYDCDVLKIGGYTPERNPIIQSKAQSSWVRGLIEEGTGRRYGVQPIVVYPGWFVKRSPENAQCDVLVLNPKILPAFLGNAKDKLTSEDIRLIHFHLSRYVRTT
jgi:hypothetical protein